MWEFVTENSDGCGDSHRRALSKCCSYRQTVGEVVEGVSKQYHEYQGSGTCCNITTTVKSFASVNHMSAIDRDSNNQKASTFERNFNGNRFLLKIFGIFKKKFFYNFSKCFNDPDFLTGNMCMSYKDRCSTVMNLNTFCFCFAYVSLCFANHVKFYQMFIPCEWNWI